MGFFPVTRYEKVETILEDAGFTQDIVYAYVYYDSDGFFISVKKEVLARYKEKSSIYKRAVNLASCFANLFMVPYTFDLNR